MDRSYIKYLQNSKEKYFNSVSLKETKINMFLGPCGHYFQFLLFFFLRNFNIVPLNIKRNQIKK